MSSSALCCRWCGGVLTPEPVLALRNMPSGAQVLPRAEELAEDAGVDLHIHRCEDCDLVQTVGEPVGYYRDVIRANAFSPAMKVFRQTQLAEWVQRHGLHGRPVLEVGSGRGEFLDLLREAGAQPWGTEHGTDAVQAVQERGHAVWQGYFGEGTFPSEPQFDAWVCFNFMEHWPEPRRLLRSVRAHLKPGAVGLVEVPNFETSLRYRLVSDFIADHVFYFSKETLRRCLESAGLIVESVKSIWDDNVLSAEVRSRIIPNYGEFDVALSRICQRLSQFADSHAEKGVAVWGAGHQTLATLALGQLGGKLRFVVDSASFKQGRYTPVSHLPIVSPDFLLASQVGAVIVMAGGYSDEIVIFLKRFMRIDLVVAVLRGDCLEVV